MAALATIAAGADIPGSELPASGHGGFEPGNMAHSGDRRGRVNPGWHRDCSRIGVLVMHHRRASAVRSLNVGEVCGEKFPPLPDHAVHFEGDHLWPKFLSQSWGRGTSARTSCTRYAEARCSNCKWSQASSPLRRVWPSRASSATRPAWTGSRGSSATEKSNWSSTRPRRGLIWPTHRASRRRASSPLI